MKKVLFILIAFLIFPFTSKAEPVTLNLFYGQECPYCHHEIAYLTKLQNQMGDNLKINKYEVWHNKTNNALLTNVQKHFNYEQSSVPYTVIGDKYFIGYNEKIQQEIKNTVLDNLKVSKPNIVKYIKENKTIPNSVKNKTINFPLLGSVSTKSNTLKVALVSGLSDAISLPSLWLMLFLTGILLSVYKNKRRWFFGTLFSLASAITYLIFMLNNVSFSVNIETIIQIILSVLAIIISAISIDSYLKISVPTKSFLQIMQEKLQDKQIIAFTIGIIFLSIIMSFSLINEAASTSPIFLKLLEIQNITGFGYIINLILYFLSYLCTNLIILVVINTIIKELVMENTIVVYSRLFAFIVLIICASLLIFCPSIFMFTV
jgi:glutaredoxin